MNAEAATSITALEVGLDQLHFEQDGEEAAAASLDMDAGEAEAAAAASSSSRAWALSKSAFTIFLAIGW